MIKQGKITFQQKSSRPPLSRSDAVYWHDLIKKIIKIGTEFEINLPSADKIAAHANSLPCVNSTKPCVTDCANVDYCLTHKHPKFCLTRSSGMHLGKKFSCPAENDNDTKACETCPAWNLNCRSLACSYFTPFCTVCPSFKRTASNAPENIKIKPDEEEIRAQLAEMLAPSGNVADVGKTGVLEVKKDGSLQHNGGVEIPTVGRRVHWNSFYSMCKNIIDSAVDKGGFVNERCGQHYHMLAGYLKQGRLISELEQPLPEIVLANFHQLCRRYELAMFWIMSTGESPQHLTRWAKFRVPIFHFGALNTKMEKVKSQMGRNIEKNGKYASVAYHFCEFTPEGNVSTFHIENRIADGCLSPAVATAWAMMLYAMIMKAVKLSQYGVMEVGNSDFLELTKAAMPHIVNGQERGYGDSRYADTGQLSPYYDFLRQLSVEMVNLLKSELIHLGPAYPILLELARKPVSFRRIEGKTWEDIEAELYMRHQDGGAADTEIQEVVDLNRMSECSSTEEWINEVAALTGMDPAEVNSTVTRMQEQGVIRWSEPLGSFISL